jgi:hypothetical protein
MTTKQRATRIEHLVTREGRASSWRSVQVGDTLHIYHYATKMAVVHGGMLTQVSEGRGSTSDKCGMAKLRRGAILAGVLIA